MAGEAEARPSEIVPPVAEQPAGLPSVGDQLPGVGADATLGEESAGVQLPAVIGGEAAMVEGMPLDQSTELVVPPVDPDAALKAEEERVAEERRVARERQIAEKKAREAAEFKERIRGTMYPPIRPYSTPPAPPSPRRRDLRVEEGEERPVTHTHRPLSRLMIDPRDRDRQGRRGR